MLLYRRSFLFSILVCLLLVANLGVLHAQDGNVVIVNTGNVNIRSGPATNTVSLGAVAGGTELTVTGRTSDGQWWRVDSPFGAGWVSDVAVVFRGTIDTVAVVDQPPGTLETPTVIVDRFPATIYRNPNADSFVMGMTPTGATLIVTGRTADANWWQVNTEMGLGFVNAADVAFRGDEAIVPQVGDPGPSFNGPTIRVNADAVVTTQPGGGDTIATLPAGTAIPASGRSADNSYWQVADVFGVGWIPVSDVSLAGAASSMKLTSDATVSGPGFTGEAFATIVIEAERKIAYNVPAFDAATMWDTRLGEESGVIGRTTDGLWLQVTRDGNIGWISFSGLTLRGSMSGIPVVSRPTGIVGSFSGTSDGVSGNIVIVNTHWLNVRSGPGVEYTRVGAAPGGATLAVTGRHPSLPWLRVEGDFGVGWARMLYVVFRGNWASVPAVEEPIGQIETPVTLIEIPRTVYGQADLAYPAGTLVPGTYAILGRTSDFSWALLQTPLGSVWLPYQEMTLRGVESVIPVVQ